MVRLLRTNKLMPTSYLIRIVIGLSNNFALADAEVVVVAVNDFGVRPGGPDEADAAGVGGQLHGALAGNRIRGIKDRSAGNGSEHGDVLQRHLRGSVLTDRDTGVAAWNIGGREGRGG